MTKSQYVTVSPVTPKGNWLVCSRRVGSKERLSIFAQCRSEEIADKVVDALNALQGQIDKLEAPAERELAHLKERHKVVIANNDQTLKERALRIGELQDKLYKTEAELRTTKHERDRIRVEFEDYRNRRASQEQPQPRACM